MNTDTDKPVYALAPQAPWREILRQRWSGRLDRALVLRDRGGVYHVVGARYRSVPPRGAAGFGTGAAEKGAAAFRTRLRGYDSAFHVRLDEYPGTRAVALPTPYGTESVDVQVLWWVHDPLQVVRSRTTHGWFAVRKDLDRRLRHLKEEYGSDRRGLGAPEMMQDLAVPYELPDCGLAYRVTDVCAREDEGELRLGEPGDAGLPGSWTDKSREEYDFCTRAVREGPVSLAALWLVRHPDQVSQVLDWAVNHPGLIRGETNWQDEVAGLLGKLTAQERQELSEMLRDRLAALGRHVPGQQRSGTAGEGPRSHANGWARGTAKGQPV
ncbi:hypothetical protein [Streptomyces lydicus]|uniref:hypothetical protein n=1 Tax=Streptomyces lydicus TaxID=47763 RepID=UPI0019D6E890|nr:hypothetical protein [Streptomyces lydicus]MCZ1006664.1 hypothetical protein [Streptomyces lydicus]